MTTKELTVLALFLAAGIFSLSWLSARLFGKPCDLCGGDGFRWDDDMQVHTRCPVCSGSGYRP